MIFSNLKIVLRNISAQVNSVIFKACCLARHSHDKKRNETKKDNKDEQTN